MSWASKAAIFAVCLAANAAAADCRTEAAALDYEAKTRFQLDFYAAAVADNPDLAALAGINRDLQLALASTRRMKLTHLAETEPDRLVTDQGVSQFSNTDWTDADEAALLDQSADYSAMRAAIDRLKAQNNGHPDWPALRSWSRETTVVATLAQRLQSDREAVAAVLATCN